MPEQAVMVSLQKRWQWPVKTPTHSLNGDLSMHRFQAAQPPRWHMTTQPAMGSPQRPQHPCWTLTLPSRPQRPLFLSRCTLPAHHISVITA